MAYRPLQSSRLSSQRDAQSEYNSQHSSNSPPVAPPLPQDGNLSNPPMYSNVPTRLAKLNQILQNFFTKTAIVVVQSRIETQPSYQRGTLNKRANRWFSIDIEETEAFKDELALWKYNEDLEDYRPMVIEVFLDTRDMTTNQVLLLVDEHGRRRIVEGKTRGEIIIERWKLELRKPVRPNPPDLPVVYKKSIVYFRTLFAQTRLLPCWNLKRRMDKSKLGIYNLKLGCRILSSDRRSLDYRCTDISTPLVGESDPVSQYAFGPVISPAGNFHLQVSYRSMCDFRVSESEALLSSQFIYHDQGFQSRLHDGTTMRRISGPHRPSFSGQPFPSSLSSNLPGSQRDSPLSSLRTPSGGSPRHYGETASAGRTSRSSLGSQEPNRRHSSVSFTHQPFKTPSLSASPSSYEHSTSPKLSIHRVPSSSSMQRPSSRPASLRASSSLRSEITPAPVQQQSAQPGTSSPPPSPAPRYSSSFGHRRSGSFTSTGSYRRVSAGHTEGLAGSYKSPSPFLENDDEEVADFVKMIDNKQPLKLSTNLAAAHSVGSRDKDALDKFHKLKDSHAAFGESLSGSEQVLSSHPSSSNLKKLFSDTETANYAVKSVSPHVPAVPSRLGEEFVGPDNPSEHNSLFPSMSPKSTPLDIPSSPNVYRHARANSFTFAPDDHIMEMRENTRKHPASLGSLDIGRLSMESLNIQREKSNIDTKSSTVEAKPLADARTASSRKHILTPSSSTFSLTADESGRQISQGTKRHISASGSGVYNFNIGVEEDELLFAMSDMIRRSFDSEGHPASE